MIIIIDLSENQSNNSQSLPTSTPKKKPILLISYLIFRVIIFISSLFIVFAQIFDSMDDRFEYNNYRFHDYKDFHDLD